MKYELSPPRNKHDIESMRLIRNSVRSFMTNDQEPISYVKQILWKERGYDGLAPFVYLENEYPIGYAIINPDGEKDMLTGALIESARGRGLGKKLFLDLVDKSRNPWLSVFQDNYRAIDTYKSIGFIPRSFERDIIYMEYQR